MHFDNIPIHVQRKPVRLLRMRICPPDAEVRVSAPLRTSDTTILRFLSERREWIHHHRASMLEKQKKRPLPYNGEHGERILLWGTVHTIHLIRGTRTQGGARKEGDCLSLCVQDPTNKEQRVRALKVLLRSTLMEQMTVLVEQWVPRMHTPSPELRIRSMKTRWGTCNPKAERIWINAELIHYPALCLEYVMVHELTHFHERGHTPRFRDLLSHHLPDWKARKQHLNEG